jgi:hypothetical protein
MSVIHVGMSVHLVQMPNVGHKPMIKRRKMLMVRVMPVVMFRRVMVLLVHMYMKLLYLWNAPLYSEKTATVHTLDKKV